MNRATAAWKQRKVEDEAALLLRPAQALDPTVAALFPRPLEDILAACLPSLRVHRCQDLSQSDVRKLLREEHGVSYDEEGEDRLAGFTYAAGDLVVIFVETRHGKDFELFTLAHEAGHIATEYLPKLQAKNQLVFDGMASTAQYFHRDPPGNLLAGRADGVRAPASIEIQLDKLRAQGEGAWLREVKANGCAAELLAPASSVRELLRGQAANQSDTDRIAAVRQRFGLSRSAAQIRLRELGLLADESTLSLFD